MMERFLRSESALSTSGCKKTMLKILVIDRCHFTRTGMEAWLNHTNVLSSSLLVSGMNNLILAKNIFCNGSPIWLSLIYMVFSTMPYPRSLSIRFCRLWNDAVGIITVRGYAVQIAICQSCGVV